MSEKIDLKPCPFCGGKAFIEHNMGNEVWNQFWLVGCKPCEIVIKRSGSNSWAPKPDIDTKAKQDTVDSWNKRKTP